MLRSLRRESVCRRPRPKCGCAKATSFCWRAVSRYDPDEVLSGWDTARRWRSDRWRESGPGPGGSGRRRPWEWRRDGVVVAQLGGRQHGGRGGRHRRREWRGRFAEAGSAACPVAKRLNHSKWRRRSTQVVWADPVAKGANTGRASGRCKCRLRSERTVAG